MSSFTVQEIAAGLELVFGPDVELIPSIRNFVGTLAGRNAAGNDWTAQIELATHELVENAVKGASRGKVRLRIELKPQGDDLAIEVSTWNHAKLTDLARLRDLVAEASAASDPEDYYRELIRRTAHLAGSGLGIGRIRAEAGMSIECHIDGDEAKVVARGRRGALS